MALSLLSFKQKWVPEDIHGDKARQARNADNLTVVYEPIV
jgi:hypothetical protein